MSDRERVRAEARELYPLDGFDGLKYGDDPVPAGVRRFFNARSQAAFRRGRTVTAEQVESTAMVLAEITGEPQPGRFERTMARAAFRAAGLLIEGDDHA